MNKPGEAMAREIAEAAVAFERQRTGNAPASVSVVIGAGTLVITLDGALSPAELALSRTAEGAARVEQLQRQLFQTAGDSLREEIQRITGRLIRSAATEIDRGAGSVIKAFPSGTLVQVYLLDGSMPVQHWSGAEPNSTRSPNTTD
jgi:uncharacterized protein YbcI